MEVLARSAWFVLSLSVSVLAQAPAEPERPLWQGGDPFEKLQRDDKLVDLQWRRNANGDLEWAIAGDKKPKWARAFADGLDGVLGQGGLAAWITPLLHRGDLLSMTDGEGHFQRVQIATDTPALAAFARAPLGKTPSRVDELDRLVAIDVLIARGDAGAKQALAQIAADDNAPAAVRERAAGKAPRRERLTGDDLLLPESADLFVVVDHSRLFDGRELMPLARFAGLLSTCLVLVSLKRPFIADAAVGQAESDSYLEVPFELVRLLGAVRFDHSCVAVSWPREIGPAFTCAGVAVGSFEPTRIAGALRDAKTEDVELATTDDGATVKWSGVLGAITTRRCSAHPSGVDVASRAEFASKLLGDGTHSVHVHVPAGSKALAPLRMYGAPKAESCDVRVTLGDPLVVEFAFTMASEEAAAEASTKVATLLERVAEQNGRLDLVEGVGAPKVTVVKNVVQTRHEIPQSRLPGIERSRKYMLEQARNR
jgi:hypothetical protein